MRSKAIQFFSIMILLAVVTINLHSVEVKRVEINTFADFQNGEFKGTSLDSKGRLLMGPKIKDIKGPGKEYYLSLDLAESGEIYVGTGHNASVYRITSQGSEEIFSSDYPDIYALYVRNNGDIYVGTSPNGRVYKIGKGKKFSVKDSSDIYEVKTTPSQVLKEEDRKDVEIFNPDEKFIWDIKEDREGNIIVAVGNSGGVYKVDKTGNTTRIFAAEDAHIVSLYITRNNSILAGSGDRGIIYKIDNMKVRVLFDSLLDEIKGICEDKEGNIFFSATKGIYNQSISESKGSEEFESFFRNKKKEKKERPREKGILYCLHTNGVVDQIWNSDEEYIYSVFYDEQSDSVIIGTGNFGRVYSVKKDGSFSILYESESAQIFKITGKKSGFTIITNNTASITQIEETLNTKGTYFSEVYDMGIQSRLGKIYWEASTSQPTEVMLFIRAGNSNIPDNTWPDWSAPFSDKENSLIDIAQVRYFQIKAVLNAANIAKPPYLESLRVYYIQANLSPQLKKIEILKPNNKNPEPGSKTDQKQKKDYKYLIIRWEAADANKDKLKYDIFLKKVEHNNWLLVKENITDNKLELKTELFEDGKYLLKITADDSLSNPPSTAKSNSKISVPFLIDSTAPTVKNFSVKDKLITFSVSDETSIIANVLYSVDGEIWYPIFPKDMINDSKVEDYSFNLNVNGLSPKKIIFIKAADEFNNHKVFQKEI